MQPDDEWNADGDVKQEGALAYKTRVSPVNVLLSVYIRSKKQQQGTFVKAVVNNTEYY
jgi:hypothetical protein